MLTVSTTGLNDLTLTSGSNTINLNATTLKTTGSLSLDMNSGSNDTLTVTNSGSGIASLSIEGGITAGNALTVSAGGINITGNSTINGTLSGLTGLTVASGGVNVTGTGTFNGPIIVGNTFTNTTGSIRWTGADFQGFDGASWQSFTAAGGGGTSTSGRVQQTFNTYAINQAASATTVLNYLLPTSATAFSIATVPSIADIRMSSAGSIRGCSILNSAAVTGGSVSVRFRKNGAQASATNYCTLDTTNTRSNTQEVTSGTITFAAGDTVGVQLVSTALAPAATLEHWVSFTVEYGTPATVNGFANGGNAFSGNALLGTTDNFALSLMTNNTTVLNLATSGLATFNGAVTTNGVLTVASGGASITGGLNINGGGITNAGNITGVGTNITGAAALTVTSGGAGNLTFDSGSNILGIAANDTTLQRSAAGTFTIDLANNTVNTLAIDNSTAGSTNLNLVDGALQTNSVTRLTNAGALQNITGLTIASGGATIAGGASITGNATLGGSSADRLTITSQLLGGTPLTFQGATDNGFATGIAVIDPTANNTITIPNASGTLVLDSRAIQTAANSGLSGGGTLGSNLSLGLDINNLNSISTTSNTDYLAVYDSGTSSVKKVSRATFLQGILGALTYKGAWNASTNTPTLSDGTGASGEEYVVSAGATRNLGSGNIVFAAGDFIIHNGTKWEVAPSSSAVSSVFGRTGSVAAQSGDYAALQITNTPAGTISAITVQAALNELDSEKLGSLNGLTAASQTFANDTNVTITSVGSTHSLGWAGQLAVTRGGTGAGSFTANGVIYGNGTGTLQVTAAGTSGQLLVANASGVPTFVSLTGDISVTATGLTAITPDSVNLGVDTAGNYVASFGTLTGLSATGNTGESSTPTLSVLYGNSANTAVQGNVTMVCASGSGNLTGGGTTITLGSGGSCGVITTVGNPSFASSVTTPIVQSSSSLSLTSGGAADIVLDSSSNQISLASDDTTLQRIAAGTFTIDLNDAANTVLAITNSGAGTTSLNVEAGASFGGNVITTGAFQVNATAGLTTLTCSSGQYVGSANVRGGIITSGTCENDAGGILSDQRLKENVVELDGSILDRMKDVRTVNFDFKCNDAEYAGLNLSCERQTGVIAQELAQVFPELVYQGEDGFNRVRYGALNIYTLKAVSELVKSMDTGSVSFNTLDAKQILASGGLSVMGDAEFHGTALFDKLVTFGGPVSFEGTADFKGEARFNDNTGGYASINSGKQSVRVTFRRPFSQVPVITVTAANGNFLRYSYQNVTADGFDIVLEQPANQKLDFSWVALSITNPFTTIEQ